MVGRPGRVGRPAGRVRRPARPHGPGRDHGAGRVRPGRPDGQPPPRPRTLAAAVPAAVAADPRRAEPAAHHRRRRREPARTAWSGRVRRDIHKAHAFVRFRSVRRRTTGPSRWSPFTGPTTTSCRRSGPGSPNGSGRCRGRSSRRTTRPAWDGHELRFGPGVPASAAPRPDELEGLWKAYYGSIFNPARVKVAAMKKEMPVRHWRTLPEAELIDDLLRQASPRVEVMMAKTKRENPTGKPARQECRRRSCRPRLELPVSCGRRPPRARGATCAVHATQTVFGEGPGHGRRDVRRRAAGRQGGPGRQAVHRPGRADVQPGVGRRRHRPHRGVRDQRRQALQVRAGRQPPHPRQARRPRDECLPPVAGGRDRHRPAEADRVPRGDRRPDADGPRLPHHARPRAAVHRAAVGPRPDRDQPPVCHPADARPGRPRRRLRSTSWLGPEDRRRARCDGSPASRPTRRPGGSTCRTRRGNTRGAAGADPLARCVWSSWQSRTSSGR